MPSPIVHTVAGLVLARLKPNRGGDANASPRFRRLHPGWVLLAVFVANAADLDFIPGMIAGRPWLFHRGASHSLAAALAVGALTWAVGRLWGARAPVRAAAVLTLAYLSHVVLDMCPVNPHPSYGAPFFWPVQDTNVVLPLRVFLEFKRDRASNDFFGNVFQVQNVETVIREVTVVVVALAVWLGGRWGARRWLGRRPMASGEMLTKGPESGD